MFSLGQQKKAVEAAALCEHANKLRLEAIEKTNELRAAIILNKLPIEFITDLTKDKTFEAFTKAYSRAARIQTSFFDFQGGEYHTEYAKLLIRNRNKRRASLNLKVFDFEKMKLRQPRKKGDLSMSSLFAGSTFCATCCQITDFYFEDKSKKAHCNFCGNFPKK
jgi:hypothetical protein